MVITYNLAHVHTPFMHEVNQCKASPHAMCRRDSAYSMPIRIENKMDNRVKENRRTECQYRMEWKSILFHSFLNKEIAIHIDSVSRLEQSS